MEQVGDDPDRGQDDQPDDELGGARATDEPQQVVEHEGDDRHVDDLFRQPDAADDVEGLLEYLQAHVSPTRAGLPSKSIKSYNPLGGISNTVAAVATTGKRLS